MKNTRSLLLLGTIQVMWACSEQGPPLGSQDAAAGTGGAGQVSGGTGGAQTGRGGSGGAMSSGAGGTTGGTGGSSAGAGGAMTTPTPGTGLFPASAPWYQDVSAAPLDRESGSVIAGLAAKGGWGTGSMRIDFSMQVLRAEAGVQPRAFTPKGKDEFFDPDCDRSPVPVPPGGRLEGEDGYACRNDGDCHLVVLQGTKLYEMWRADISGTSFLGGCLAVWDTTKDYWKNTTPYARGEQCSSADAAGYPIAALLFTADEVKAGEIKHAIRFILPNDRIRKGEYVHPATHSGAGKGTPSADTVPYGARLRLKASVDLGKLKPGARVVARAMQRYGMFLSDGGNIALTAQADTFTAAKWDGLLAPGDLSTLKVTDFEMVEAGARIPLTLNCQREPLR